MTACGLISSEKTVIADELSLVLKPKKNVKLCIFSLLSRDEIKCPLVLRMEGKTFFFKLTDMLPLQIGNKVKNKSVGK